MFHDVGEKKHKKQLFFFLSKCEWKHSCELETPDDHMWLEDATIPKSLRTPCVFGMRNEIKASFG